MYDKPVQQYCIAIQYCHSPGTPRRAEGGAHHMTTLAIADRTAPPLTGPAAGPATVSATGSTTGSAAGPDKGLRAGALGLISSVVIAVSSTAPAYSMAATLGLIVAVVGVHSPGTLIASFLPMLCIAYAFRELNKADPDSGTTFTWTARAFAPRARWIGGWGCALSGDEEPKAARRRPGRGGVRGAVMVGGILGVLWVGALGCAGRAFLAAHSTDARGAMASSVLGSVPGKLLVLWVLASRA